MPEVQSLTEYVAEFVSNTRFENIPEPVLLAGRKSILEAIGVGISGTVSDPGRITREYAKACAAGTGTSTVFGAAFKTHPRFAAFANGTAMHADDFDDTLQAETGRHQGVHPTSPVLAATLATAESLGLTGRQLVTAYHVGVEVCCRIFDSANVHHVLDGFHVTGTCGTMGAAAGMAALMGADVQRARTVLGIAGSLNSGLQANVGTMVKSFHAGHAAESGVVAQDLAAGGFDASLIVLESPRGFFNAEGGPCEEPRIRGKLGTPFSFAERGLWLKPFPNGSLGHAGMSKMQELVIKHDLKPGQVEKMRVRTNENNHKTLQHHHPKTGLQAKFSFEFFLTAILFERKAGLKEFTDEYVNRPEVQDMMRRVEFTTYSDAEAKAQNCNIVTTFLDIVLKNGETISARADHGKGSTVYPMSEEEVAQKFRDCADYANWPRAKTEQAIDAVLRLEKLTDLKVLTQALAASS